MKKRGILSNVGGMVIVSLSVAYAGAENIPSASDLLNKYTQALDSTVSFREHYEKSTDYSFRTGGGQDKGKAFARGQIRYDGRRVYIQQYHWGDFNHKLRNLPEDQPYYSCNVVGGEKIYQNCKRIGTANSTGSAALWPRPKDETMNLSRSFGVSFITGYINSDDRLDEVLRKADRISVRGKTENVGGSECFVIDADTKDGRYLIWLDPEHGFHPAKVINSAKEGNYSHSHLLAAGDTAKAYLQNVRFEKINGIWVPVEADAGTDRRLTNGLFTKEDYHYKRTEIILNPDHDKLGSFADPISENPANDPELNNGTRVRLTDPLRPDIPAKQYTWQDSKLVPEEKQKGVEKERACD